MTARRLRGLLGLLALAAWAPIFLGAVSQEKVGVRLELDFQVPEGTKLSDYRVDLRMKGGIPHRASASAMRLKINPGRNPWVLCDPLAPPRPGKVLHVLSMRDSRAWRCELTENIEGPLTLTPLDCGSIKGILRESIPSPISQDGGLASFNGVSPHVMAGATLSFERIDVAEGEPPQLFSTRVPVAHEFRLPWVEAGLWRVEFSSKFYPSTQTQILVGPLVQSSLKMTLGKPLKAGALHIRLVDARGDIREWTGYGDAPDYTARVNAEDWSESYLVDTSSFCGFGVYTSFRRVQHEGRWILEAEVADLPDGPHLVKPSSKSRSFEPSSQTVKIGEVATFTIRK